MSATVSSSDIVSRRNFENKTREKCGHEKGLKQLCIYIDFDARGL
jgi:hypothetical protein